MDPMCVKAFNKVQSPAGRRKPPWVPSTVRSWRDARRKLSVVGLETVTLSRIAEVLYQAVPRSFRGIKRYKTEYIKVPEMGNQTTVQSDGVKVRVVC
jgi:hypothetical protein